MNSLLLNLLGIDQISEKLNILYGGRFVNRLCDEKLLSLKIGIRRKVMYRRAKTFGYTHPRVVACSQRLDELINRYHSI